MCERTERRSLLDSREWSKKFDVLSISRLFLRDELQFTAEQITTLSDEDMARLADYVMHSYSYSVFCNRVRVITATVLAEIQTTGGEHELR